MDWWRNSASQEPQPWESCECDIDGGRGRDRGRVAHGEFFVSFLLLHREFDLHLLLHCELDLHLLFWLVSCPWWWWVLLFFYLLMWFWNRNDCYLLLDLLEQLSYWVCQCNVGVFALVVVELLTSIFLKNNLLSLYF